MEFLMDCPQGVSKVVKRTLSWFNGFKPKTDSWKKTEDSAMSLMRIPRTHNWGDSSRRADKLCSSQGCVLPLVPAGQPQVPDFFSFRCRILEKGAKPCECIFVASDAGAARTCGLAVQWATEALSLPFYLRNTLTDHVLSVSSWQGLTSGFPSHFTDSRPGLRFPESLIPYGQSPFRHDYFSSLGVSRPSRSWGIWASTLICGELAACLHPQLLSGRMLSKGS